MTAILIFSAGVCLAYTALIYRYISGWNSLPEYSSENREYQVRVSVVIAFRNEEKNIPRLLEMLKNQSYPPSLIEIIFADDHSEDRSVSLVSDFTKSRPGSVLVSLGKNETGKKSALAAASLEARGELLVFTDADCTAGNNWIKRIVECYMESKAVLIASPVVVKPGRGFLSRFQALEFLSLLGSTAGAFGHNDPVMVNGANLAVQRDIYLESIPFLQNGTPSGDDVFLMLHLKKRFADRMVFLKNFEATVFVKPFAGLGRFVQQRLRWVSKSRFYRDRSLVIAAMTVLIINLWLLNCFIMSFFNNSYIYATGFVFIVKSLVDWIFLRKVTGFFRMKSLMRIFVLSQFLYFLYISFTGVAGNLSPYKWKGRVFK